MKRLIAASVAAFSFAVLSFVSIRVHAQEITTGAKTIVDTSVTTTVTEITTTSGDNARRPVHQPTNLIRTEPFKLAFFYNLSYLYLMSPHIALGGGLQYSGFAITNKQWGPGVSAEMRYYPGSKALTGFYLAPNVEYNALKANVVVTTEEGSNTIEKSAPSLSLGLLAGWQWFASDFAFGLALGVDYWDMTGAHSSDYNLSDSGGLLPAFRIDVGIGW